ncbi:MAG: hypothetical protein CXT71_07580 [Methanobacteriota archaeon]|jgi:hypothetical protein|nr:MAG: hypothetical protein CXT71_07580 [Euryarchaeota archaeon]
MIGTPIDVLPYIRGVQLIMSGYSGYAKGIRIETDKMVRAELNRVVTRVRSHMQNIFDIQFKEGNMSLARAAKQCIEECDYLSEDIGKSIAGMEHAFLSGQRSPSNRDLKNLIKHDHDVIDMVIKAVNLANQAEDSISKSEDDSKQYILQTTQKIASCKGFFAARATLLAGLKKK